MNTARIIQSELEVKPVNRPCGNISTDYITEKYGVHFWNPSVDKLAKKMWMPKGLRPKNAAMGTGGKGNANAAPKAKPKLKIVPKIEPGQQRVRDPKIATTDLVDGRVFGKKIVTIRRKQGKRACQHIGKRFFEIAGKNIGRGSLFYLSAGYGILESR